MNIQTLDARRQFVIPGDTAATLTFCANHFVAAYQKAVQQKGYFYVALSGGSTPKALFQILTTSPYKELFIWDRIHLFWSDERNVPPDHLDSNYHMAMESGFGIMGIPKNQIHRMIAEEKIEEHAKAYEELLRRELPAEGFDYLCLGMGEDGHTASLFPETRALTSKDRLVVANEVPQKNSWRMTLTFPCINAAKQIVLYVLGDSKKEKVQEIFIRRPGIYPVEQVGTSKSPALWILDTKAASLLAKT